MTTRSYEQEVYVVRALEPRDAEAVHRIDRRSSGRERRGYLERRLQEALQTSGIRRSLAAECAGEGVGFLLAGVDYGEFGLPDPVAVVDTLGVDPGNRGQGVGRALVESLLAQVRGLGIDRVQTIVDWDRIELLGFLREMGFAPSPKLCLERATDGARRASDPADRRREGLE